MNMDALVVEVLAAEAVLRNPLNYQREPASYAVVLRMSSISAKTRAMQADTTLNKTVVTKNVKGFKMLNSPLCLKYNKMHIWYTRVRYYGRNDSEDRFAHLTNYNFFSTMFQNQAKQ